MWAMGKEAKPNHPGLGKLELALLNGFVITARVAIAYCLRTPPGGGIRRQYDHDAFGMPYIYNAAGAKLDGSLQRTNSFLFTGREWLRDLRICDFRTRQNQPPLLCRLMKCANAKLWGCFS
jgi:hypothetical protein